MGSMRGVTDGVVDNEGATCGGFSGMSRVTGLAPGLAACRGEAALAVPDDGVVSMWSAQPSACIDLGNFIWPPFVVVSTFAVKPTFRRRGATACRWQAP